MCVGVTVWFGWGGVVSLCRLKYCIRIYYSRGLLMMGIVVPETCSAFKKYNKIISGI